MTLLDLLPLLVAIAAWMPQIFQWIGNRNKTKSEAELNVAQAAGELVEGGERAVAAAMKLFEVYEKRIQHFSERVELQDKEIAALRAQVIAMQIDEQAKEARMSAKLAALEQYIRLLIDILRVHDIEIPPRPDILKESDPKIPKL